MLAPNGRPEFFEYQSCCSLTLRSATRLNPFQYHSSSFRHRDQSCLIPVGFPTQVLSFHHLQHVGACDARAKKAVAINLADVSDLVADRRDLADGSQESLLRVLALAEAATGLLL